MKTQRFQSGGQTAAAAASGRPAWQRLTLTGVALACALAAGVGTTAFAASAATDKGAAGTQSTAARGMTDMKVYRGMRASEVIGMSVRNAQGNDVGRITDMVVNLDNGEVQYAVLAFDPGIFQGEKVYSVPTTALRMAPDRNDIVYDVTRAQLERGGIDRSDWESQSRDPGFFSSLDRLWGSPQPTARARAYRASELLGRDVKSRGGENIGEIEELVIDMANRRVHYAVLQFDPGWSTAERNYAFPLRSFDLGANRQDVVLDIDRSLLQSMKSFGDDRYGRLNEAIWVDDIDRYLATVRPVASGRATGSLGASGTTSSARSGGDGNSTGNRSSEGARAGSDTIGRTEGSQGTSQARAPRFDRN